MFGRVGEGEVVEDALATSDEREHDKQEQQQLRDSCHWLAKSLPYATRANFRRWQAVAIRLERHAEDYDSHRRNMIRFFVEGKWPGVCDLFYSCK